MQVASASMQQRQIPLTDIGYYRTDIDGLPKVDGVAGTCSTASSAFSIANPTLVTARIPTLRTES